MPEVDFHILSLTGSGREPVTWELRPTPTGTRRSRPGARAPAAVGTACTRRPPPLRRLLRAVLLSFLDPEAHCDFGENLYDLAQLARDGRLSAALRTETALRSLM